MRLNSRNILGIEFHNKSKEAQGCQMIFNWFSDLHNLLTPYHFCNTYSIILEMNPMLLTPLLHGLSLIEYELPCIQEYIILLGGISIQYI